MEWSAPWCPILLALHEPFDEDGSKYYISSFLYIKVGSAHSKCKCSYIYSLTISDMDAVI